MSAPLHGRADARRAAVLIVDIQERLAQVMPAERMSAVIKGSLALLEAARLFDIPVVATAQYPQGLGPIASVVAEALEPLGHRVHRFDKTCFSVARAPEFTAIEGALGKRQWWVAGMEAHICVLQTVRDLREANAEVLVAADGVVSRTDENRAIGLELMRGAGATVVSSETLIFDALGDARHEHFRALSRAIR